MCTTPSWKCSAAARDAGRECRGDLAARALWPPLKSSGLARDAYMERMPTPDPVAAAVLEEAFAELGERAAKNEALRRAYAASGKTVARVCRDVRHGPGGRQAVQGLALANAAKFGSKWGGPT
jgi:hypothetical protein